MLVSFVRYPVEQFFTRTVVSRIAEIPMNIPASFGRPIAVSSSQVASRSIYRATFGVLALLAILATAPVIKAQTDAGSFAANQPAEVPRRVAQDIDEAHYVSLTGRIRPDTQPQNDRGSVEMSLPVNNMTLWFRPSPEQQAELESTTHRPTGQVVLALPPMAHYRTIRESLWFKPIRYRAYRPMAHATRLTY